MAVFVYLLVLLTMVVGASTLAFSWIHKALLKQRLSIYDARGFFMVALVFVTFVMTSLAYYWGDIRFEAEADQLSLAILGVLFTLCCSLGGLAFGLVRLKESDSNE